MAEPSDPGLVEAIKNAWVVLSAAIIGALGFLGKQRIRKYDKVTEEYVPRDEINGMVNSLREQIRDGTDQTHARLDKLNERFDRFLETQIKR